MVEKRVNQAPGQKNDDDPENALCDGSCMLELAQLERLLAQLVEIRAINLKYQ